MSQRVHCIVAMNAHRVIGVGNKLPWRIPEDMAHFKAMTLGKAVIMGRNTWNSIPEKFRPLQGRANFIVTRSPEAGVQYTHAKGVVCPPIVQVYRSVEEAIESAHRSEFEPWVIGGAQIYAAAMPYITDLHVTRVAHFFTEVPEGTVHFPELTEGEWIRQSGKELGKYASYVHYTRQAAV